MEDTLLAAPPAWFNLLCAEESRPELAAPMTIAADGRRFTVAGTGHRMLALHRDYGFPEPTDAALVGQIRALLDPPDVIGGYVALPELRAFLEKHVPITAACATCRSRGYVDCCDKDCDEECLWVGGAPCDEYGDIPCRACGDDGRLFTRVQIGDGHFNPRLFARPIAMLAGEVAFWYQLTPTSPALLIGNRWRLVVAALRRDEHAPQLRDRFVVRTAAEWRQRCT